MATDRRATREREILDVAARLFCDRGYSATTVDDIAAEVGLNKAMLYYYFSNKAGMLYHIYLATVADLNERLEAVGVDDGSADDALGGIVQAVVAAITTSPDYVSVFFQERQWLQKWLSEEQYETVRNMQAEFLDGVRKVIERGIAEGAFAAVDPMVATSAVVGMTGWTYQWYRRSERHSSEELAGTLVKLALDGLRPRPVAPTGPRRPAAKAAAPRRKGGPKRR